MNAKIKNILLIVTISVFVSVISMFITIKYIAPNNNKQEEIKLADQNTSLFNSRDVNYNNSNGIRATNVQSAIDEVYEHVIDYNSIDDRVSDLEGLVGSDTLTTTAQTLTGAINELDSDVSALNGKIPQIYSYGGVFGANTTNFRIPKKILNGLVIVIVAYAHSTNNYGSELMFCVSNGVAGESFGLKDGNTSPALNRTIDYSGDNYEITFSYHPYSYGGNIKAFYIGF